MHRTDISRFFRALCVTVCVLSASGATARSLDPDLARQLDESFVHQMERYEIPGGAFVVVRDGEVVHTFAHGWADLEARRPVEADRTLFYLASVTKPLTAAAVLQLVEEGKLDLHRDVNETLRGAADFVVPATFDEPVTLHQLLTHTAGFDDKNIGYVARTADEARALGSYLATDLPPRRWAPGRVTSYSNHGYGLAGHLVEIVSGESYADYLERRVLAPLGMRHTSARMPPSAELARDLATPYRWDGRLGHMVAEEYGYRNLPPAGSVSATVTDMARFLIAQLEGGSSDTGRLLAPETVATMQRRQFGQHPRLPGFAYGLYEHPHRGQRVLEHAGGYIGAGALLVLVPEARTGLFVATNQATFAPHRAVRTALLDHLFPQPEIPPTAEAPQPPAGFAVRARQIRGRYHHTRFSRHNVEKIALFDGQVRVRALGKGMIELLRRGGDLSEWVEIEPYLFRASEGRELLAFGAVDREEVTHLYMDVGGGVAGALEKLPWYEADRFQVAVLFTFLAIFTATIVAWPAAAAIGWAWRRWRRRPAPAAPWPARAVALAWSYAVLVVVFLVGIDALLGNSAYRTGLVYGMSREMVVVLWIPIVAAALTVPLAVECFAAWRRRRGSLPGRIGYSLVTLAAFAFVAFTVQWNLLGFQY